jgi:SAM-dependent methyltransferase
MAEPTRWVTDTDDGHSQWYVERFRAMAADGADLAGEARLVDAMLPRRARVLDAGCGPGRVGAELHARGHTVVGVDVDPVLIEAAEVDHPGPHWLVADLAHLDLATLGEPEPFDAAVLAGNVIVVGFHVNRHLALDEFDRAVADADLVIEHRFATWDLKAWHDDADFAVTVLRHRS